jgi:hypothetical protein
LVVVLILDLVDLDQSISQYVGRQQGILVILVTHAKGHHAQFHVIIAVKVVVLAVKGHVIFHVKHVNALVLPKVANVLINKLHIHHFFLICYPDIKINDPKY